MVLNYFCGINICILRSDDGKIPLLKAVITGPADTPYTGGVFEFDIYFPPGYPRCPPKVKFRTTGAGSVRFNPNLYNEGKVSTVVLGSKYFFGNKIFLLLNCYYFYFLFSRCVCPCWGRGAAPRARSGTRTPRPSSRFLCTVLYCTKL